MGANVVKFVQEVRLSQMPTPTHKALMLALAWFADDADGIIPPGVVEAIESGRLQLHTKTLVGPKALRRVVVVRTAAGAVIAEIDMEPPTRTEARGPAS